MQVKMVIIEVKKDDEFEEPINRFIEDNNILNVINIQRLHTRAVAMFYIISQK